MVLCVNIVVVLSASISIGYGNIIALIPHRVLCSYSLTSSTGQPPVKRAISALLIRVFGKVQRWTLSTKTTNVDVLASKKDYGLNISL